MNDHGTDFIYSGKNAVPFMLPNGLKEIVDFKVWEKMPDAEGTHAAKSSKYPMFDAAQFTTFAERHPLLNFVRFTYPELDEKLLDAVEQCNTAVLVIDTDNLHGMAEERRFFFELIEKSIKNPVVISRKYSGLTDEELLLYASTDVGGLLIDGLGDGVFLNAELAAPKTKQAAFDLVKSYNSNSFGILQAARPG